MDILTSMGRSKSSEETPVLSGREERESNQSVREIGSEPRLGTEGIAVTSEFRYRGAQVGLLGSGKCLSFQAMCTG